MGVAGKDIMGIVREQMAGAAPIQNVKDLVQRMPLVAKGVVEEYLPDQQWADMKDRIQAQMTKAFEAPEDFFVSASPLHDGNDQMMFTYLFYMPVPMLQYIAQILEAPRSKKNPVRLLQLRNTAEKALSDTVDEDEAADWSIEMLAGILTAYVFRRVRTAFYESLSEPILQKNPIEFFNDVLTFSMPSRITQAQLDRVYGKALEKVKGDIAWAEGKVAANRAEVAAQLGQAGGRRTRRAHRRRGTRKSKRGVRK